MFSKFWSKWESHVLRSKIFGKKSNISYFRVIGSKVFVHIPKERRKKWDKKSEEGVFVGYSEFTKGYRVGIPTKNQVVTRRDVIFQEDLPQQSTSTNKVNQRLVYNDNVSHGSSSVNGCIYFPLNSTFSTTPPVTSQSDASIQRFNQSIPNDDEPIEPEPIDMSSPEVIEINSSMSEDSFSSPNASGPISTRLREEMEAPNYEDVTSSFIDESIYVAESLEPLTFEQALQCDESKKWMESINDEYKSLLENDT